MRRGPSLDVAVLDLSCPQRAPANLTACLEVECGFEFVSKGCLTKIIIFDDLKFYTCLPGSAALRIAIGVEQDAESKDGERNVTSRAPIEICEMCRRIRLVVVAMFLVSTVLAGYLWAHAERQGAPQLWGAAAFFTALSVVLILGIEIVVTKTELQAKRLFLAVNEKEEETHLLREKIRELDRSIARLADENQDLRQGTLSAAVHQAGEGG